ncbi:MAG: hypothetical protein ACRDK8_16255, partial [Solirubrobacteraceae bacterium]
MRRIRGALGLRGRIAGAVFLSAVVTLVVAAVALLGPLEHSLRSNEIRTLRHKLGPHPTLTFARLPLCTIVSNPHGEQGRLGRAESHLAGEIAGRVVVLGSFGLRGNSPTILPRKGDIDEANALGGTDFSDATLAYRRHRKVVSTTSRLVRESFPFTRDCPLGTANVKTRYVLAVRKSIAEIPAVAYVVRRAFFDAALAALALTVVLGIPLSGRLVRRLRRLREVAIDAAHDAPMIVPVDNANDEVGDLA